MNNDKYYLMRARSIAKHNKVECGSVLVNPSKTNSWCSHSNKNGKHAYINCINDPSPNNNGATLYLTHGVNPKNAMQIVNAGIKRVVFIKEFGIGVGTALLRSQGVIVEQFIGDL